MAMEIIFKSEQDKQIVKQVQTTPDATGLTQVNLGDTVVAFGAQVITNIITTNPIKGIEDTTDPEMIKFLDRSEFFYQPAQIEIELSLRGDQWAYIYYVGTDPYFKNGKPSDYRRIGKTTTMFEITLEEKQLPSNMMYIEQRTIRYEILTVEQAARLFGDQSHGAGVYQIGFKYIKDKNTKVITLTEVEYAYKLNKYQSVPAYPFINMQQPWPDAKYVDSLKENLNYHSNQTKAEWEFTKAQATQTSVFNGDNTANEIQENILSGDRVHSTMSQNGVLRDPLQPLVLSNNSLALNQVVIGGYEDKLLKYMFSLRDSISSGTNKHNTEVATFNQIATDMATFKIERFRNNQWTQCWKELVGPIIALPANFKASLSLTEVEQNKVDTGNPFVTAGMIDANGNPVAASNVAQQGTTTKQ